MQSHRLARKWMKKAADHGHSKAQFEHGLSLFSVCNTKLLWSLSYELFYILRWENDHNSICCLLETRILLSSSSYDDIACEKLKRM